MFEPLFNHSRLYQSSDTAENVRKTAGLTGIHLSISCVTVHARHLTPNILKLIQLDFWGGGGTCTAGRINGYGVMTA